MSAAPSFEGLALDQGSLGFDLSFFDYARISARAGFSHVEVPLAPLANSTSAKALARTLADLDLQIGTFTYPWEGHVNGAVDDALWGKRLAELPRLFDYARSAGASRVCAFFNDSAPGMVRLSTQALFSRLNDINQVARSSGIVFCAELNSGPLIKAGHAYMKEYCPQTHSVRLLVDLFHLFRFSLESNWIQSLPVGSIGWIHIADAPTGHRTDLDPQKRLSPGEGEIPILAWLDAIWKRGYTGPISVEVLQPGANLQDPDIRAASLAASARRFVLTHACEPRSFANGH